MNARGGPRRGAKAARRSAIALPADYHLHSLYSDGQAEAATMIARVRALALPEAGISDHLVPVALDDGFGTPYDRLGEYMAAARAEAAASPSPLLVGLEIDYSPETLEEVRGLLELHRPDYVIGSIHFVHGFAHDLPDGLDGYAGSTRDLWLSYYELLSGLARARVCDVLGHADLVKKFGRLPARDAVVVRAARSALKLAARNGMAIELNTAGWRDPVGEQYPSLPLLAYARELGMPLTFGSDAHAPDTVAYEFSLAVRIARAAGYVTWLRLSDRRQVPL